MSHKWVITGHKKSGKMILSSVILTNSAVKRAGAGELWFGARDVAGRKSAHAGIARLGDKRGRFVAAAFLSPKSRYYLRVISREAVEIGKEFWRERILLARAKRRPLEEATDAFRVVHAEADGIPSVVIDKYNDVWSVQITSQGAETIKDDLIDIIVEEFAPASIIEKNNLAARKREGLSMDDRIAFGAKTQTLVREGDQKFSVDVLAGQKTGAYLDYRGFRLKGRELARGSCLDAFSYEGWFSCQIAKFASGVVAVESSARAVARAEENAALGGHKNIRFVKSDVFDYLDKCGERFDFIHLDPPPFAKGHANLKSAIVGYRKLLKSAFAVLKPRGTLLVSSCSHAVTEGVLEKTVLEGARAAGFECKIIFRGIQDSDHPVIKSFTESLYLKAVGICCS